MRCQTRSVVLLAALAALASLTSTTAVCGGADLAISTSVSPAAPVAQTTLVYHHSVSLVTGSSATGVMLTDMLPPGTTFSAMGSDSRCTADVCGSTVTCAIGTLTGAASVAVAVVPGSPGSITNVAGIAANEYDAVMGNNTSTTSTDVLPAASHSISGRVTLNSVGLPGVVVASGVNAPTATTDSNGYYTISGLANGTYPVTPSLCGYTFSPSSASTVVNGANVPNVNFAATALTYSISGTITLGGAGLAGVTVTAGSASATTNSAGFYTVSGLQNGSYTVIAALAGYSFSPASSPRTITCSNLSGVDFTATATATYSISGAITLSGLGLSGVTVTAGSSSTTTDSNGSYTIAGVPNGTYAVTPSRCGYTFSPSSASTVINGANTSAVNFAATALAYSISGTITLGGSGLAGVTVTAGSASATTNAAGSYTITGLPNGSYAVTPSLPGYTFSPASSSRTINCANVSGVTFTATAAPTYSISGAITLGGVGLSGVSVTAGSSSATTDSTGSYTIAGLANGTYSVTPSSSCFTFSPPSASTAVNGANVSGVNFAATARTYSISGTITVGGVGLAGVSVTAGSASATTNAAGSYTISGLPNGSYAVTPSLPGYVFSPGSASRTITCGSVSGVNFTAAATYSISGTITAGGAGLSGVTVTAGSSSATTDANGSYTISGLVNGTYAVTPSRYGYTFSPPSASTLVNGASVSGVNFLATPMTYSISGVVTLGGAGLPGVTITAGSASVTTDASGAYTISGLNDGTYQVVPTLAGYTFTPGSSWQVIIGSNLVGVDFVALSPGTYSISGTLWVDGGGFSGVTVAATWPGPGGSSNIVTATTDGFGQFVFPDLPNGEYTVFPSVDGFTFTPPSAVIVIDGANVSGVDFVVASSGGPSES